MGEFDVAPNGLSGFWGACYRGSAIAPHPAYDMSSLPGLDDARLLGNDGGDNGFPIGVGNDGNGGLDSRLLGNDDTANAVCNIGLLPVHPVPDFDPEENWQLAVNLLEQLARTKVEYSDWIRIAYSLKNVFGERALPLWLKFSQNPHYHDTERSLRLIWEKIPSPNRVNMATIIYLGGVYGCQ